MLIVLPCDVVEIFANCEMLGEFHISSALHILPQSSPSVMTPYILMSRPLALLISLLLVNAGVIIDYYGI